MSKFLLDEIESFLEKITNQLKGFEGNFKYKYGEATDNIIIYIQEAQDELSNVIEKVEKHRNNIEEDFYNDLQD